MVPLLVSFKSHRGGSKSSKQVDKLNLTFFPEPEILGEYASLPSRFLMGQRLDIADKRVDQVLDRGVLTIGTDLILGVAPDVIHRVQLRATLGQPDQADLQFPRQPDRAAGRMAGIL